MFQKRRSVLPKIGTFQKIHLFWWGQASLNQEESQIWFGNARCMGDILMFAHRCQIIQVRSQKPPLKKNIGLCSEWVSEWFDGFIFPISISNCCWCLGGCLLCVWGMPRRCLGCPTNPCQTNLFQSFPILTILAISSHPANPSDPSNPSNPTNPVYPYKF